jgi:putative PIN family toxin of toxin-antitoxin system
VKVVPDTMIWLSYCTLENSYRHRLIKRAVRQRVRFYVSEWILGELEVALIEDLGRTRRYATLARRAVLRIAKLVDLPTVTPSFVPADPNDDPIVQTALTAKADYLVTADAEILYVGKVQDVEILTAAQFEERLGSLTQ